MIGQPAHAWVSGQIARAWGNERFGGFEPWEEVCLAAEQHDLGMAAWDAAPGLNAETAPNEDQAIRDYLAHERAFQQELIDSVSAGPRYTPYATPEVVARMELVVAHAR